MGKVRPKGGRPNRRGRSGRGGKGPGPAYKPNPNTGGTRHNTGNCMTAKVVGAVLLGLIAVALGATAAAAAGAL